MTSPNGKMYSGVDDPLDLSIEDMHQNDHGEEGITVAIRMRPLNHIEGDKRRVWKVLPKYSSVTQTTRDGKPLPERVIGRTFFTFDKTFGEDANTARVYADVAQGIVTSVVNGLNGTIFAYGQTSSGKTHTMQGSGTIQSGSTSKDEGGIVHMAAKDIFSQIEQLANDRIFLVRASFLEIYNEEVRDLLSPGNPTLHIREDPKRGVFVQSVEEIVTDFESLLRILFEGEKSRAFAATAMNERSSRSHTIFRVTIESRQKGGRGGANDGDESDYNSDEENNDPNGDGAVRVATLNLVDLAGSESVRHTGATGERKKEGAMINQSLLTLSRVMVALGSSNATHVNFRDSKLTRILQPSLSGNARMAVICCATPSELYLEETRSTLQFASRAKLVKTNAKINEVLDDRSIIRRLQKELAEARRSSTAPPLAHLKALETKAAKAGTKAMEAQAKLDRLKSTILNGGHLFGAKKSEDPLQFIDKGANFLAITDITSKKKRRRSDGFYNMGRETPPKSAAIEVAPNTLPRPAKKKSNSIKGILSPSAELGIVREALSYRSEAVTALKSVVAEHVHLLDSKESEMLIKLDENKELVEERDEAVQKAKDLEATISYLRSELDATTMRYEESLAIKDEKIHEGCSTIEKESHERDELRQTIASMESDLRQVWDEAKTTETKNAAENAALQSRIQTLTDERDHANRLAESIQNEKATRDLETAQLRQDYDELQGERVRSAFEVAQCHAKLEELQKMHEADQHSLHDMRGKVEFLTTNMHETEEEKDVAMEELNKLESTLAASQQESSALVETVSSLEVQLTTKASEAEAFKGSLQETEQRLTGRTMHCQLQTCVLNKLESQMEKKDEDLTRLLESYASEQSFLDASVEGLKEEVNRLAQQNAHGERALSAAGAKVEKNVASLNSARQECNDLRAAIATLHQRSAQLSGDLVALREENSQLGDEHCNMLKQLHTAKSDFSTLQEERNALQQGSLASMAKISEIESETAALDGICKETEKKLEIRRLEKEAIEQAYSQVLAEKEDALSLLHESKEDAENLRIKHSEVSMRVSQLEAAVADLQERLTESSHAENSMRQHRCDLEATIAQLTMEKSELESQYLGGKAKLIEATARIESLEKNISTLEQSSHNADLETMTLRSQKTISKTMIGQLENEKTELERQLFESSRELEAFERERELSNGHSEKIQLERDEIYRRSCLAEDGLRAAEDQILLLRTDVEGQVARIAQLESDKGAMQKTLTEVQEEAELLWSEKETFTRELNSAKLNSESLEAQLENLLSEKATLEDGIAVLQADNKNLAAEKDEVKCRLRETDEKLNAAISELAQSSDKFFQLEEVKRMLEERIGFVEIELASSQQSLGELQIQNQSLQSALQHLEQRKAEMEDQYCAWQSERHHLDENLSELAHSKLSIVAQLEDAAEHVKTLQAEKEAALAGVEQFSAEVNHRLGFANAELFTVRSHNEALEGQVAELVDYNAAMLEQKAKLTEEADSIRAAMEALEAHQRTINTLKNDLEGQLLEERETWTTTKQTMEENIDQIVSAKKELELQLAHSQTQIAGLQSDKESLLTDSEQSTKQLISRVEAAESRRADMASDMNALRSQVAVLESDLANSKERRDLVKTEADKVREANQLLEEKLRELEGQNFEVNGKLLEESESWRSSKEALEDRLADLECSKATLTSQLEEAEKEISSLFSLKEDSEQVMAELHMRVRETESQVIALRSEQEMVKSEASKFAMEVTEERASAAQQLDAAIAAKTRLESQLEELATEKSDAESNLHEKSAVWKMENTSLENKLVELENIKKSLYDELKFASDQINALTSDKEAVLADSEESIAELHTQLHEANLDVDTSRSEMQVMQTQIACLEAANSQMQEQHTLSMHEVDSLREANESLEARLEELDASKLALEVKLQKESENSVSTQREMDDMLLELEDKMEALHGQLEEAQEKIKSLLSEKESLAALSERSAGTLHQQLTDMQQQQKDANDEMKMLLSEKERLLANLEQLSSDHYRQLNESRSELELLRLEREALNARVSDIEEVNTTVTEQNARAVQEAADLRQTIDPLKAQIQDLETSKFEIQSLLNKESTKWESEKNSWVKKIEELDQSNAKLLEQLVEAEAQIRHLQSESVPQAPMIEFESRLQEADGEILRLGDENMELKRLLAAANESVEEARDAALLADDELKTRERELEDALYRLSQLEDELSEYDARISDESKQDLLQELHRLMEEKQQVQDALNKERKDRTNSEDGLKRQIGEEQRTLINEGEKRMEALRIDAENLRKALKQSEDEAYVARQEIEEQRDLVRDANAKLQKFEEQISRLTSKLEDQEGRVANLMSSLNKAKADNYVLKDSVLLQKERLSKALADGENASNDSSETASKLLSLETQISVVSQEKSQLVKELEQIKRATRENELTGAKIEKLRETNEQYKVESDGHRKKIERLQLEVISKDERIQKLKAVCLTKKQMDAMKRVKAERVEYLDQLGLARREIEALRKQANVSSTDAELAEVRFEKEALETKLRKYAAHCQRLEDDRSGIIDVIKSCDKALLSSGDVHEAVMILCDKVTSLEEECESISKGSRSANIAGDIDRLQRENATLKASLATSRSKLENMGKPGTELSKQLTEYKKQLTSISSERDELKKQVEEARGGANGAESKLRFLEQENLQLMLDLKGKSKQLQRHREELEHLRLKSSVENPTLAFGTIDLMSMNDKALQVGKSVENPKVKGVSGEMHGNPTPLKDNQRHARPLTRKKRSSAEADEKGSPSQMAKENMTKTNRLSKESPAPSSAKKRRFGMPTSGKNQKSQREVLGLGEANVANDDNTGECKQS